jgi:hypothetical protein
LKLRCENYSNHRIQLQSSLRKLCLDDISDAEVASFLVELLSK